MRKKGCKVFREVIFANRTGKGILSEIPLKSNGGCDAPGERIRSDTAVQGRQIDQYGRTNKKGAVETIQKTAMPGDDR